MIQDVFFDYVIIYFEKQRKNVQSAFVNELRFFKKIENFSEQNAKNNCILSQIVLIYNKMEKHRKPVRFSACFKFNMVRYNKSYKWKREVRAVTRKAQEAK